jgi:hypothetical protein
LFGFALTNIGSSRSIVVSKSSERKSPGDAEWVASILGRCRFSGSTMRLVSGTCAEGGMDWLGGGLDEMRSITSGAILFAIFGRLPLMIVNLKLRLSTLNGGARCDATTLVWMAHEKRQSHV